MSLRPPCCQEGDASAISNDDIAKAELPQSLFKPTYNSTSINMKDLSGQKNACGWATWSAQSFNHLVGQAQFARYVADSGCEATAPEAWKTELLQVGSLLQGPDGRVRLCLQHAPPMRISWVVEQKAVGADTFFYLLEGSESNPCFDVCFDFSEWKVIPFRWSAPVGFIRANGCANTASFPSRSFGRKVGEPVEVLTHAAMHGFRSLQLPFLKRLARSELGLELTDSANLVQSVFEVCAHILGGAAKRPCTHWRSGRCIARSSRWATWTRCC